MNQGASGLRIRDCGLEDVRAVLELWRQADATPSVTDNPDDLRRAVADSPAHVLLAEVQGRIIGSIIGTFDGWRGNIYRMAVHPDYRRQGVARALVAEVEKRLATQGARRVTALVEKEHGWAADFWQAVGYGRDHRIARHVRTLEIEAPTPAQPAMNLAVNEHIHLTEVRPSDKAACVEHLNEKDIYDRTLRIPFPYTLAHAEQYLAVVEKNTRQNGQPANWAIRNEPGHLIGSIGFEGLAIGKSHKAEIGYWLAKPYWGRGIMTAVVHRACEFAFQQWGLARITAHVFALNAASARVLEKCGFVQEGYLRKHHQKDGQLLDARLYGLVR
jgi:RimJ/RimL family protein N-acetyltransferase